MNTDKVAKELIAISNLIKADSKTDFKKFVKSVSDSLGELIDLIPIVKKSMSSKDPFIVGDKDSKKLVDSLLDIKKHQMNIIKESQKAYKMFKSDKDFKDVEPSLKELSKAFKGVSYNPMFAPGVKEIKPSELKKFFKSFLKDFTGVSGPVRELMGFDI